jgi:hypothetical protein
MMVDDHGQYRQSRYATNACLGKQPFAARSLAAKVAAKMHRNKGMGFSVYRCKTCHNWHIGGVSE